MTLTLKRCVYHLVSIIYLLLLSFGASAQGYKNPVLPGFHAYNRLSADYALNDQLYATLGYDFFHADRGSFTVYDNNSEVFLKLKYSF